MPVLMSQDRQEASMSGTSWMPSPKALLPTSSGDEDGLDRFVDRSDVSRLLTPVTATPPGPFLRM